jgi:hypothetical protein
MGASKRLHESVLRGNYRPTNMVTVDLVKCQRCKEYYVPNGFEACDRCVEELDHNMEMEDDER